MTLLSQYYLRNSRQESSNVYIGFRRQDSTIDAFQGSGPVHGGLHGCVRFVRPNPVSGYLELAKPLTRPIGERDAESGNNFRFFFQIAASL